VHLVGFNIRIYHYAWSPELQIRKELSAVVLRESKLMVGRRQNLYEHDPVVRPHVLCSKII